MNHDIDDWLSPWPIENLVDRFCEGDTLYELMRPYQPENGKARREEILEEITREVMIQRFGADRVFVRRRIGALLNAESQRFPASSQPDVVVEHNDLFHICELKSSRVDYSRFDCILDSLPLRNFLQAIGHQERHPWEVEQDLIKLHLYRDLSQRIGCCIFLMLDAYAGEGRSWTKVFEDRELFVETMRTQIVKRWVDKILQDTQIHKIHSGNATARLIICKID